MNEVKPLRPIQGKYNYLISYCIEGEVNSTINSIIMNSGISTIGRRLIKEFNNDFKAKFNKTASIINIIRLED